MHQSRLLRTPLSRFALAQTAALALSGLALVGGCNKDGANGGGGSPAATSGTAKSGNSLGVVDLDRVSKSVGWDNEIKTNLETTAGELKRQLEVYLNSVNAAMDKKKEQIGAAANLHGSQLEDLKNPKDNDSWQHLPLSKDQRDDLERSAFQVNQNRQAAQNTFNQYIERRKAQLAQSFGELARPVVRRVAVSNNVTAVTTPATLFYYDPSVDLTDKVIDELQKNMPQHTLPEMPKLDLPTFHFQPTTGPAATATPAAPSTQPK